MFHFGKFAKTEYSIGKFACSVGLAPLAKQCKMSCRSLRPAFHKGDVNQQERALQLNRIQRGISTDRCASSNTPYGLAGRQNCNTVDVPARAEIGGVIKDKDKGLDTELRHASVGAERYGDNHGRGLHDLISIRGE